MSDRDTANTGESTFQIPESALPAEIHAFGCFYNHLEKEGVEIERIELTESAAVELEYTVCETGGLEPGEASQQVGGEIGLIAGSYAPPQTRADLGDLNVLAHTDTNPARWSVDSEWAKKYDTGEMSGEQLFLSVRDTVTEVE